MCNILRAHGSGGTLRWPGPTQKRRPPRLASPRRVLPSGVLASRQARPVSVIGRPRVGVIKTTAAWAPSQPGNGFNLAGRQENTLSPGRGEGGGGGWGGGKAEGRLAF